MSKKVFIRTFGCQMNEYDSTKIVEVMREEGYDETATADGADLIVFNTCSVREKAQEKVFSDLGRVREMKKRNPDLLIGVGGCVAAQEGDDIIRRAPYVDVVFGPQTLHRLPDLIRRRRAERQPQVDISFPEIEKFDHLPMPSGNNGAVTAYVSVMEGCSKYCSFCVVPYTRGEEISRPLPGVLEEVRRLAAAGVREVTLLGQNVNGYRVSHEGYAVDFAALLDCVSRIDGIERVRFTTSHPVEFGDRLIEAYADNRKLPDYLHLPVQSGSDPVLARMKRGYTALEYKSIIRRLRRVRPDILISSDFIVGFPGETDKDFEKTMQLVEEVNFDFSYSFLYSRRPGTPAATLRDDTPLAEKKARLSRLQAVLEAHGRRFSEAMVGSVQTVLVEGESKRGEGLCGRTANNRVVNFAADADAVGSLLPLRILESTPHSLRGEVVATASSH